MSKFYLYCFVLSALLITGCQTTRQQQKCLQIQTQTRHLPNTLHLADYRVSINKLKVEGIENNLSALTWNKDTGTLFGTLNKPPTIIELSTDGKLLRLIQTKGISDLEAIEYIGNHQFIIADEQNNHLFKITISQDTSLVNGYEAPKALVAKLQKHNKGLEGLAYDPINQIIYAANEARPMAIYQVSGFIDNTPISVKALNVDWASWIRDISGLEFNQPYQHLLILSDESKLVLEMNKQHQIVGCMPLIRGQYGLLSNIRQPEGIAMDDKNNLYIVSEPNLFYKFEPQRYDTKYNQSMKIFY